MKKYIFGLLYLLISISLSSTYAYQITTGDESASLSLSKDYFTAGKDVVISDPVLWDANIAGQTITLNTKISWSFQWAWQTVLLNAPVNGSARIFGQNIIINKSIDGDVIVFGDTILVNSWVVIGGDLVTYATDVKMLGIVKWTFKDHSQQIQQTQDNMNHLKDDAWSIFAWFIGLVIIWKFFFLFLWGLLVLWLAPRFVKKNVEIANKEPGNSFLVWVIVLVGLPIASLIAFSTMIGRPLGVVCALIFVITLLLYELLGTAHLTIWFLERVKIYSTRKYIGLLILSALIFSLVSGLDIIIALFFLGAQTKHKIDIIQWTHKK